MVTKTVLVVAILFTLQSVLNGILLDGLDIQQSTSGIHHKLGKILNSCYASSLNTLVATEDLSEVTRVVSEETPVNVFLVNENFDPGQRHGFFPRWPVFLLSATSETALTTMLQRLRSSDLWKSSSTFFIVGSPGVGCDSASAMLHATWKMDVLTSFFICEQSQGQFLLYTFNPFTNLAPRPWKRVQSDEDKRWTLYSRPYSDDVEICKNLNFDKTKSLKRYPVKVVADTGFDSKIQEGRNDNLEDFEEKSFISDAKTLIEIWSLMKVIPAITYVDARRLVNGAVVEFPRIIKNGTFDVAGLTRYLKSHYSSFTYPFTASDVAILTKHREFLSPVEKIINFYSLGAVCLIGAAFLMTWLVFVLGSDAPLSSAALEVLRVVLSTGVLRPLRSIPLRIYLFGIWWLVIILNSTFQGHMDSFLTKPERFDVQTLQDLKRYHYHIYVPPFYYDLLFESLKEFPKDKVHVVDDYDCYPYVLNNSAAACIQNIGELYEQATKYDLHVSRPLSFSPYLTFFHRTDWPLAKKMNQYMSRLAAAGILDHWLKVEANPQKKHRAKEAQDMAPLIRPIRLSDLSFAFALLAIGIIIAGFCLLGEIRDGAQKKLRVRLVKRTQLSNRILEQNTRK